MAEVESYEFAVLVNGNAVEWFKSFYSEGQARRDAIVYAKDLMAKGKDVSIELTVTYAVERKIVWDNGQDVTEDADYDEDEEFD